MTASWLAQMAWEVFVLEAAPEDLLERGPWVPTRPPLPEVAWVTVDQLGYWLDLEAALVIDLDPSPRYFAGHVPGAWWASRTELIRPGVADGLPRTDRLIVTSADGWAAALGAADLAGATDPGGRRSIAVLAGGTNAWIASGRPLESGATRTVSTPQDVYRRPYEGIEVDPATMKAYLEWEYGLVAQLERDGSHGFTVIT
jgi:3-mercaptopyruvate sulfurtransferase SseA